MSNINETLSNLKVAFNQDQEAPKQESVPVAEAKPEETKEHKIQIINHDEFSDVVQTALITTHELCTKANSIFKTCFSDYEGCIIEPTPDPFNPFRLRLFFTIKPKEEGKIHCLEKVGFEKGDNAYQRLSNFNIMQKNKTYNVTDAAKEALEDFINVPQGKKIQWNQICVECSAGNNIYGRNTIYMAVYIDLLKLIKFMYGTKEADGSRIDYQIVNLKPLGEINVAQPNYFNAPQMPTGMVANFLVGITKLNSNNLKAIATKIGYIPDTANGIPMVRAED